MWVKLLGIDGSWLNIKNAALNTIGKDESAKEPSPDWIRRILLAEHSPIRKLHINWKWFDLKYWVSTHYVRHKFGIEHWVSTQRTDRTGIDRDTLTQNALVMHECQANPQAMINISRKRRCRQASPETREAWESVVDVVRDVQPELASVLVPDCIYRGWCYEYKSCGYHLTPEYQKQLSEYRKNINGWRNKDE